MPFGPHVCRIHISVALLAIAATFARPVSAAPGETVNACIASYERYERQVDAGEFTEARKSLGACAAATCPAAMQRECISALAALEPRIPTLILVARDERKRDLTDVRVLVDGVVVRTKLDGRELEINPGKHIVRFEMAGASPVEQTIVVRERDKGRVLDAELKPAGSVLQPIHAAPAASAETASAARKVPTLSWIFGAVGVAGLGTSAAFGAAGLSARSDLNACRPACSSRQVDVVNERLLAADIALGIGVVSLVAAAVVYFTQPPPRAPEAVAR